MMLNPILSLKTIFEPNFKEHEIINFLIFEIKLSNFVSISFILYEPKEISNFSNFETPL